MKKSNAQRQRNYRDRHLKQIGEEQEMLERINQMVSLSAKNSLKRLASCYGVTQRAMLERAIEEMENKLLSTLPNTRQNDYYDMKITLRSNDNEGVLRNEKLTG
jgi:hypothetical protein